MRIWAHYTFGSDVNNNAGSASGNTAYSGATEWTQLSNAWVFDSSGGIRDGLMIEVRFYDSAATPTGFALIDDLSVVSSAGTITVPPYTPPAVPVPGAVWLLGSGLIGLLAVARYRESV